MELVDAVIKLHDIARIVESEIGIGTLSLKIREAADDLHRFSQKERIASVQAKDAIDRAKE